MCFQVTATGHGTSLHTDYCSSNLYGYGELSKYRYVSYIFTRDSIYAIARICYRPLSVCPSVCHTGGSYKNGWS